MKQVIQVATGEWAYWLRSHLALGGALVFLLLTITTSITSTYRMNAENHLRSHQQGEAEQTFLAQPDRHPHRMVHYGHYVFRTPTPLAIFDPGLDFVTGQTIFLEGHRQNTATFTESTASANFGGFSMLTPAFVYQLFAPLLIILLGHGSIVRERESAVLASMLALGITGNTILLGKALALLSFSLLVLLPLVMSSVLAVGSGENPTSVLLLFLVYLAYLMFWGGVTLWLSTILRKRSTVLAISIGLWFVASLVLPSLAVNLATNTAPLAGKLETDLAMLRDLRKLGDGHNANDSAFQQLRQDTLEQYGVDQVEDLPINFRGVVAMAGEKKLTEVLNEYADRRMAGEMQQEKLIANYGWLTPSLAIAFASRSIAGTDLSHYHRFQKEAEALRFSFVQGLNQAHVEQLSYQDDINRNKDEASWLRARVDSSSWQVLNAYKFQTASLSDRFSQALFSIRILVVWLVIIFSVLFLFGRRITP